MTILNRLAVRALTKLGNHRKALDFAKATYSEPELALLNLLVPTNRGSAVDVGAANGIYTNELLKLGVPVVAVDANPENCELLRNSFPEVRVEEVALSDRQETAVLRIPMKNGVEYKGWATIEDDNQFPEFSNETEIREMEVQCQTLDALDLGPIGFIKIDVESHELSVLKGALKTLEKHHPNLLIEVEGNQRGSQPEAVHDLLVSLNYRLFALSDGVLTSFDGTNPVPRSNNIIAIAG